MLMNIKIYNILFFLLISFPVFSRQITDMAGRSVTIPDQITRIIPYDSKTSVLLYPCAGEKLIARGALPGTTNSALIADDYNRKPTADIKNLEEVLAFRPDLILAGSFIPDDQLDRYEKLQSRTGIPVVIIDLSLDQLDKTYSFLGKLLNCESACQKYVSFLADLYQDLDAMMAKKSLDDITVYYTLGANGLMTDPSGSRHTEVLDFLKIPNAAKIELPSGGHAKVNMEQVIAWDPDYIFAAGFKGDSNPFQTITGSQLWSNIKAVRNKQVYIVPGEPFGWFDHPPTINRVCGLIWLSEIFYNYPEEEAKHKIKAFYSLFYHYELTDFDYVKLYNR